MIKKHGALMLATAIVVMILAAFAGIQFNEGMYFKQLALSQAANDVELTALDLNSQITNISTEQRVVSQMMANDIFLKEWCEDESSDATTSHAKKLYAYLKAYKEKYDYDTVFFVSNRTYNYYYDGGLNKVISPDDDFDVWYFNFLDLNKEYDIQIDHDEVNNFSVALFVNCRVLDENGDILGVVGAGKRMEEFESSVETLMENLSVNACIVNIGNAHNSFEGSAGIYKSVDDAAEIFGISADEVVMDVGDEGYTWYDGYLSTTIHRNNELDWNIIVQKNTYGMVNDMLHQTYGRVSFMLIVIMIFIVIAIILLSKLNVFIRYRENTDELTGLINSKLFRETFDQKRKKFIHKKNMSLFILDIDNFKNFNDSFGHMYGNTVIRAMGTGLKEAIGKEGIVSRWGGDEFIGLIFLAPLEAKTILDELQYKIRKLDAKSPVSFSCGIVKINHHKTLDENFNNADKALYESKAKGKAQCTIVKEL